MKQSIENEIIELRKKFSEILNGLYIKDSFTPEELAYILKKRSTSFENGLIKLIVHLLKNPPVNKIKKDTITKTVFVGAGSMKDALKKINTRNTVDTQKITEFIPNNITTETKEVTLFELEENCTYSVLEQEYSKRNLTPIDLYTLIALNAEDMMFGKEHPNATFWKINYEFALATFGEEKSNLLNGEPYLRIKKQLLIHNKGTWYAGIKKS